MKRTVKSASRLGGTVALAGDKSISMRAALLNSIAGGTARVSNLCVGDDRASILRCLRGLGARIRRRQDGDDEWFEIQGKGLGGLREPKTVLNAGNSGTTMRLVTGLLAAQPFASVITGDRSLRSRPMGRIVEPLRLMGAEIIGRRDNSLAPLAVRGGDLKAIDYKLPVASAQIKSAVLIAGLYADGRTTVLQPNESRDHTERMLGAMGADVQSNGLRVAISPSELTAVDVTVPGDMSSAAFWMVAACIHPEARVRLPGVGINPTRTGVLRVLQSMGANIALENVVEDGSELVADIVVESSQMHGTEIAGSIIPQVIDEIPVLAVAAALAEGETIIRDAAELRIKESDRIAATVEGLEALGANVVERPDGMAIEGVDGLTGATCASHGDHRIAMAMAVAGLVAHGETVIDGAEAAGVSYPEFWDTLDSLSRP